MGVGIEFFPSNEKNQGIQIGCPDLLCLVLTKKMQGESLVLQRFLNFKLYIPVSLKSPLAHSKQTYTESLPLQQFMKNLCRFTGI